MSSHPQNEQLARAVAALSLGVPNPPKPKAEEAGWPKELIAVRTEEDGVMAALSVKPADLLTSGNHRRYLPESSIQKLVNALERIVKGRHGEPGHNSTESLHLTAFEAREVARDALASFKQEVK